MNREWTDYELDVIRADTAARVPRPVTAAKLGRPVAATRTRALMIGQSFQVHRGWTPAEVALLRDMMARDPPPTDKQIEAEIGRKPESFRPKLVELGLVGKRRFRTDLGGRPAGTRPDRPRGTKTRDEAAARAARKAARLAAKAERAAAAEARKAARSQAAQARAAAREASRAEASRIRSAEREAVRTAQAARRASEASARSLAVAAARQEAARASAASRRAAKPPPAAPARPASPDRRLAMMRAALDRVADRRVRPAADPAMAEERLLALLGGRGGGAP